MTEAPAQRRAASASIVAYRLGGREYPMVSVGTCKVCQSPHRLAVEQEIIAGRTWGMIERSLLARDPDADLSGRNIRDHYRNNHLPLEHEAGRRIIERRAEQRGLDIERGVESLVDGLTAAELVIQKGVEALQSGELKPDLKDVMAAARLLETFGAGEDGPDQTAYVEAFMVYHETAAAIMPPEMFAAFGQALSRNPVLRALVAKHSGGEDVEDDVVDGDVIDESGQTVGESPARILDSDVGDAR